MYFCNECKLLYRHETHICPKCNRPTSLSGNSQSEMNWFSQNGYSDVDDIGTSYFSTSTNGSRKDFFGSQSSVNNGMDFFNLQTSAEPQKISGNQQYDFDDAFTYNDCNQTQNGWYKPKTKTSQRPIESFSPDINSDRSHTRNFVGRKSVNGNRLRSVNWGAVVVAVVVIIVVVLIIVNFEAIVAFFSNLLMKLIGALAIFALIVILIRLLLGRGRRRFF